MAVGVKTGFQQLVEALKGYYGESEARSIARIVFEDALQIRNLNNTELLSAEASSKLSLIQQRLQNREPVQYVLGQADFYGLKLEVSPAVLIPRQETEELVHLVLIENPKNTKLRVLDIGTGSGCIPLAISKNRPHWQTEGLDISAQALAVAKKNAENLKLNVLFRECNILEKGQWEQLGEWDIIISNPPYIPERESELMPHHVLQFEPQLALFVSNEDPLLFYRTITAFAKKQLLPGGLLYFEVNEFNATEVVGLLEEAGFSKVRLEKDMQGKDRIVCGRKN